MTLCKQCGVRRSHNAVVRLSSSILGALSSVDAVTVQLNYCPVPVFRDNPPAQVPNDLPSLQCFAVSERDARSSSASAQVSMVRRGKKQGLKLLFSPSQNPL